MATITFPYQFASMSTAPVSDIDANFTAINTWLSGGNIDHTMINYSDIWGNLSAANATKAPTQRGFSAYLSANQSIASSAWTKAQINTKDFDYNSWYDNVTNYRFQPTIANVYNISAAVLLGGTSTGASFTMRISIYKNGSAYKGASRIVYPGAGNSFSEPFMFTNPIYFNGSTDYVEIWVQMPSAGSGLYLLYNNDGGVSGYNTFFSAF